MTWRRWLPLAVTMSCTLFHGLTWAAGEVPLPDTGQTTSYTTTFGEDADYIKPRGYTINNNGTVTDKVTKLQWQQADDGTLRTWDAAGTYCQGLTLGDKNDWRLPTKMELSTLVNSNNYNPAIDTTVFPDTKLWPYWSSTVYAVSSAIAWAVDFRPGDAGGPPKTDSYYVRCVRSGQ